mgnify:CR=1 FL=1
MGSLKLNIFQLLALKGTTKIILALSRGSELTYSQLVSLVGQPATTSRALKLLTDLNLVKRRVVDAKYRPVMYSLTDIGIKLADLIEKLITFEEENLKNRNKYTNRN